MKSNTNSYFELLCFILILWEKGTYCSLKEISATP